MDGRSVPVRAKRVIVWKEAISAAKEQVNPSLKHAGTPRTYAFVTAMTALAVSIVRGPTTAASINRNSGATLTQTHCRPSASSDRLSPVVEMSRVC